MTDLSTLSPEEKNVRLAELVGWKMHDHPDCLAKKEGWVSRDWETWVMRPDGKLVFRHDIPRFCSDLNAVAAVEATLQGEQRNTYASHILMMFEPVETDFDLLTATATQRTEALIATLSK